MASEGDDALRYDETPYADGAYYLTHPGHIAAVAAMFGFRAVTGAVRVLELGCGSGFNLLAMSMANPAGTYVGVDLSGVQIRHGQAMAAACGAPNVELIQASIDDFDAGGREFDYILAHGVYCWVPPATRDSLLRMINRHLAPDGVAYISYNTDPGWHLRRLVRDGLRFFNGEGGAAQAREGMARLTGALFDPNSEYGRAIQAEWALADAEPDSYLVHEHLSSYCDPLYFEAFAAHARAHGLQFLAESRFETNSSAQPEAVVAELDAAAGPDLLRREQHLDWLAGRCFRQTLLCRADRELTREADPDAVLQLQAATPAAGVHVTDPALSAVQWRLRQAGAGPVAVADLEADILAELGMEGMAGMMNPLVASVLVSGWRRGLWMLRADVPEMAREVSERPVACPLARLQARGTSELANRMHRTVTVDEEERRVLLTLDGSRPAGDDAAVVERLLAKGLLAG